MIPIRDLNPTRIVPFMTIGLILLNVATFFLWQPRDDPQAEIDFLYERAAIACELTTGEALTVDEAVSEVCRDNDTASPAFPGKNVWLAGLVSMFLHGGIVHLISNMWFLWVFGNNIEEAFGSFGYIALYLLAGIVATGAFVVLNPNETVPLVGASGAIAGVLGAYLVLFPTHRILSLLFVFFVPVPALIFLGVWFFSQFGIPAEGVAWQAHVGGFVFGVLVTLPIREFLLKRVEALHATVYR